MNNCKWILVSILSLVLLSGCNGNKVKKEVAGKIYDSARLNNVDLVQTFPLNEIACSTRTVINIPWDDRLDKLEQKLAFLNRDTKAKFRISEKNDINILSQLSDLDNELNNTKTELKTLNDTVERLRTQLKIMWVLLAALILLSTIFIYFVETDRRYND